VTDRSPRDPDAREQSPGAEPKRRRVYHRPRITFVEELEALAVDCTPTGGKNDAVNCPEGPISS